MTKKHAKTVAHQSNVDEIKDEDDEEEHLGSPKLKKKSKRRAVADQEKQHDKHRGQPVSGQVGKQKTSAKANAKTTDSVFCVVGLHCKT